MTPRQPVIRPALRFAFGGLGSKTLTSSCHSDTSSSHVKRASVTRPASRRGIPKRYSSNGSSASFRRSATPRYPVGRTIVETLRRRVSCKTREGDSSDMHEL